MVNNLSEYKIKVAQKELSNEECLELYTTLEKQRKWPLRIMKISLLIFILELLTLIFSYIFFHELVNNSLNDNENFGGVIILCIFIPLVISMITLMFLLRYFEIIRVIKKHYPLITNKIIPNSIYEMFDEFDMNEYNPEPLIDWGEDVGNEIIKDD